MIVAKKAFTRVYDNTLTAYVPTFWAMESLAILREKMVISKMVNRDFSPMVASHGDTINTRRPAEFTAKRKTAADSVTIQNASATNVPVVLNQHVHTSFLLKDAEMALSMKNLVDEFVNPAGQSLARFMDRVLLGQYHHFINNNAGRLRNFSKTVAQDYIVDTRKVLNVNKAPEEGRNLIWGPNSEAHILKSESFTSAEKVGDAGTAFREASIGRKLGFDHFMGQNTPSVTHIASATTLGAVNLSGGYAAGTTTMTVDGLSAALSNNCWFTVAGDDTPQRLTSSVGGATPTSITFTPGLKTAVVNDAVITFFDPGQVNLTGGYAAGWLKEIVYDTFPTGEDPAIGQMISFGTTNGSAVYTVVDVNVSDKTILLDRPLVAAIANDDKINVGPSGEYNIAMCRNALGLVIRPLQLPMGSTAMSAIANYDDLTVRAVITYDGERQGHLITLDFLMGVALFDVNQGAVLLG